MNQFRNILLITMLLVNGLLANAQADQEERGDRIQAAKVAYITSKLNLSTSQAQQFWPLYNEFEEARKKIRKQIRQLRIDNMVLDGSDEELKADIRKLFALRMEELQLEKTYSEKFLTVLSPKQLAEYYRSEKEFTRLLLKRLKDRKGKKGEEKDE